MNTSSIHYIAFLAASVVLNILVPQRYKTHYLLLLSFVFCGFFGISSVIVVTICIAFNYVCGLHLAKFKNHSTRKRFFSFSVAANILLLAFYKYAGTISTQLSLLFESKIIFDYAIPVGISFYIFQAISYQVDIYKQKISPERSFIAFALFILFFPKIIAGPIERAIFLLPQFRFKLKPDFERIRYGMLLILWGLFQKIVIADRLSVYVDAAYASPQACFGIAAWLAIIFYSFQIYCDFNGYTDIARGSAILFGYNLSLNFRQPYLATSVQDFWRRWHISLSSWLRDYLYIPLGGGRVSTGRKIVNLLIVFLVCGIWHGSSWTFVIWGMLHGCFVASEVVIKQITTSGKTLHYMPSSPIIITVKTAFTFLMVSIGWVFFRAKSIHEAFILLTNSLDFHTFSIKFQDGLGLSQIILSVFLILFIYVVNLVQANRSLSTLLFSQTLLIRWAVYYFLLFSIILLPGGSGISQFIYYNF